MNDKSKSTGLLGVRIPNGMKASRRKHHERHVNSHERVMAAFADLNRMIEQQQQAQKTAQSGAQGATMIGPTLHHIDGRQSCCSCGTRVFTYADEIDNSGAVLRHLCARCARIARGEPVCRICGELIVDTDAGWRHVNDRRRHAAVPLIAV
jgi:hypothetical protein